MLKEAVSDFEIEMHTELKDKTVHSSRYEFLKAHNGIRPNCLSALLGTTGCLSGDTVVRINRNGNARKYSLKELCIKFGEYPGIEKRSFEPIKSNRIRSYIEDEDRIGLRNFIKVTYSGVKDLYTMTLEDGKKIKATRCHDIMTDNGMIQLGSLKVGDSVMVDNNVRATKGVAKKIIRDNYLTIGKHHKYVRSFNEGRSGRTIYRIEGHRVIFEANLNNMSVKEFQEATKTENSLLYIDPSLYDIHHIDFDHKNNDLSNLKKLTKSEHRKLHANISGKKNFSQGIISYSKIKSIEYHSTDECFDVYEVHGTNNFTANDIVVSNCGKSTLFKCIIAEAAAGKKVLVWLSEETVVEYQELINYLDRSCLKNISFVEEREIPKEIKDNQSQFFEYFEQMVDESDASIVFVDNVTTSRFYSSYFGFIGQQHTAEFLIDFVKRKCSVFYVAHTNLKIIDNYDKIVYPGDIRGSKELPNMTEYFYIIQKFTAESKQYNVLRVAKFRHHEKAAGWYALKYEQKAYTGDAKVTFATINKIFKMRDYFGKKLPVGEKKPDDKKPKIDTKGSAQGTLIS